MARLHRRDVDGVLLLDKPVGISSNDALQHVRWLLAARKAGHGGTLDPLASGLLPIAFGEATRFLQGMTDADKVYRVELRLGEVSTTTDGEGVVSPADPARAARLSDDDIEQVLARFRGTIAQTPPMHSALKHKGRPLYEYARKGIDIERPSRPVTMHRLERLDGDLPDLRLRVHCSKGTYIRVLVNDIGEALGTGAWMTGLRREAVAGLGLDRAVTMAQIEQALGLDDQGRHPAMGNEPWSSAVDGLLAPVDLMLADVPRCELPPAQATRFCHGQPVSWQADADLPHPERVRVYGAGRFLGVGRCENHQVVPLRVLASAQDGHVGTPAGPTG